VEKATIDLILEAMLRSPTGKNLKPWSFLVVDDRETLDKLSVSKAGGAQFLRNAPQCILILADETKTDIWIEDASIAATVGHLTAESLGVGSCWIQVRNRKTSDGMDSETYVQTLFDLPKTIRVVAMLSLGYPDEHKEGHDVSTIDFSVVKYNTYN
jgi:nitroreductase